MKIWLINKGHGGVIGGVYQTMDRVFHHKEHDEFAAEGVYNRLCGDRLITMLKAEDRKYIDICPTELDLPLWLRRSHVNDICNKYGRHNCVLLELHGNGSPEHNATGAEIWTAPGQSKSDHYANILAQIISNDLVELDFRSGYCPEDPDPDKEAPFFMLVNTDCPAVLPEVGFYDNWKDWQLMKNFKFRERYVLALMKMIRKIDSL